jgi:enoyl-CoA hydratase/carnithine racemase|uniref:Enoyl-CoA hydratase domain-containing protein 3, mitochondrial n=1 Tax=Desulfobacca acetoxidans TaxID=60893 RepID=A0A7C3Z2E4_9BACT
MEFATIVTEKKDLIGTITLNRPEKLNTFSSALARELNEALRQMDGDGEVRVVVVKGAGKAFSTGIDISEFAGKTAQEYQEWISLMDEMHLTIADMAKPVIAMVHGYAVANGAGLMFAADFSVVAEGTKIGTTAINVGLLCTGPIIPVSYALGKQKALEMLLSGDMIDAAEAYRLGLVNKLVPPDKLEAETLALAQKIISKSPLAVKMGKQFYYQMLDMPFRQRFTYSSEVFARLCTSEDAQEGIEAFLSKRPPVWRGK